MNPLTRAIEKFIKIDLNQEEQNVVLKQSLFTLKSDNPNLKEFLKDEFGFREISLQDGSSSLVSPPIQKLIEKKDEFIQLAADLNDQASERRAASNG